MSFILQDLYRGKYAPLSNLRYTNDESRRRLDKAQEEILAALPEEKKHLVDASQDAYMELVMDEGEAAFQEGVAFGVKLMTEVIWKSRQGRRSEIEQ